jgi:hypothetical protein
VAIGVLVVGVIVITVIPGIGPTGEYDSETVKITDNKTGNQLERVSVRIADTPQKRYTGLSNTESLAEDEGMLFIHDSEDRYGYVMRDMSFPIDIIFIDATGTITRIYHAKVPTDTTTDELNDIQGVGGMCSKYHIIIQKDIISQSVTKYKLIVNKFNSE